MVTRRCGKFRYEDKKAALSARNAIIRSHRRNNPGELRVYPCPECNGFHLAHIKEHRYRKLKQYVSKAKRFRRFQRIHQEDLDA